MSTKFDKVKCPICKNEIELTKTNYYDKCKECGQVFNTFIINDELFIVIYDENGNIIDIFIEKR